MDYKILIVDDEAANLRLLERLFRNQFNVFTALSGAEGLELLKLHDVALIISDQRMPEMTGVEFLKRASEMRPHTVRIILTGYTDINSLIEAINSGVVYKYVTKPWENEDLRQTVNKALHHYETVKGHYEISRQNERLQIGLKRTVQSFVQIVVQMLSLKSPDLPDHCRRTQDYAVAIGHGLNLEPQEIEQLSLAAYLHEVAHIERLLKTKQLTEEEYRIVKQNFESELQVLESVPELEDVAFVLCYQHEHYDGTGFLEGLHGEQIPLNSRIIAVANKYDELLTSNQLQQDQTKNEAIKTLQFEAGKKFDPEIVKILCQLESSEQSESESLILAEHKLPTEGEMVTNWAQVL